MARMLKKTMVMVNVVKKPSICIIMLYMSLYAQNVEKKSNEEIQTSSLKPVSEQFPIRQVDDEMVKYTIEKPVLQHNVLGQ